MLGLHLSSNDGYIPCDLQLLDGAGAKPKDEYSVQEGDNELPGYRKGAVQVKEGNCNNFGVHKYHHRRKVTPKIRGGGEGEQEGHSVGKG